MNLLGKVVNTMYDNDALKKDDVLTTTSKELSLSSKIEVYLITITNQDNREIDFSKVPCTALSENGFWRTNE